MKVTNDEIDAISNIVVKRIREKYYLVEKPTRKSKMYGIDFIDKCVHFVAEKMDLSYDEIMGKKKSGKCIDARMLVYYIVRRNMKNNIPLMQMGAYFNKHHSTLLNGKKVVEGRMSVEAGFKKRVREIESEFVSMYNLEKTISLN